MLNCPNAQIVWYQLGIYEQVQVLNQLEEGPLSRLSQIINTPLPLQHSFPSKTLIPYALWHIWKSRNKNIFENTHSYPNTSLIIGEATEYTYLINYKASHPKPLSSLHIKYYKLNCDGAFTQFTTQHGIGGIFRDITGQWVRGYTARCNEGTPTLMELHALLEGLRILLHKFIPLEIEVDSTEVIHMLHNHNLHYSSILY